MNTPRFLLRHWKTFSSSYRYQSSIRGSEENQKSGWRKSYKELGEWRSKFELFAPEKTGEGILLRWLQTSLDLRPNAIKRWWLSKKEDYEIFGQAFIADRHQILGNDLATAHFILYRGGKVKFRNESNWHVGKEHNLPSVMKQGYDLEAVDATDVNLHYEGFFNFKDLKHLKSLTLKNCSNVDDWCLDYISGELPTLEYLDLQNCQNITERGLACLYRLQQLKCLNVSGIPQTRSFELTCLVLEETIPYLEVKGVDYIKH